MNQLNPKLLSITFLTFVTLIFTWLEPWNYPANARAGLIPAPNLQPEEPVEILSSETTNTLPTEVKTAVINDVVKRTSKTVAALKILEAQPQQWSDGCLGLGKPDEICTQALVSGWRVVVTDGLRNWTYRTDDTGNAIALERRSEK